MSVCLSVFVYPSVCICVYECMCVCACVCVSVLLCVCVCVCVCVFASFSPICTKHIVEFHAAARSFCSVLDVANPGPELHAPSLIKICVCVCIWVRDLPTILSSAHHRGIPLCSGCGQPRITCSISDQSKLDFTPNLRNNIAEWWVLRSPSGHTAHL